MVFQELLLFCSVPYVHKRFDQYKVVSQLFLKAWPGHGRPEMAVFGNADATGKVAAV